MSQDMRFQDSRETEAEDVAAALATLAPEQSDFMGSVPDMSDPACPFDVEVNLPRVVSLTALLEKAGKPLPPSLELDLQGRIPVLVNHGIIAFFKDGVWPQRVSALSYRAELTNVPQANTVAWAPDSAQYELGRVEQKFAVNLGGAISGGVPDAAGLMPGSEFDLNGCKLGVSTEQGFVLNLEMNLGLTKIQAGGYGSGCVRWNLYQQDEPLKHYQALIQTLLLPPDTAELVFNVSTSIHQRGVFFGLFGNRTWASEPREMRVPLG